MQKYLDEIKDKLYGESVVGKIWGVALPALKQKEPPTEFPDLTKENRYFTRDVEFWTSGFFAGNLYTLLERSEKYPKYYPSDKLNPLKLEFASKWWAEPLVAKKTKTDNHDLGFMIEPAFKKELDRSGSEKAKEVIVTAAHSLATRYDPKVGCIRSWDDFHGIRPCSYEKDLIVIIDNMCNLNLLYMGAILSGDLSLSTIATTHAENTLKNHFREDMSSYHALVYDRETGKVKEKITVQGYADESSWARGQAWGILGYAETYYYTKDEKFLDAAKTISKYYMSKLPEDGVPPWDFHAPDKEIKDVASAMAAGLGMLKIYEYTKDEWFLNSTLKLVYDCTKAAYNDEAKWNDDGSVDIGKTDTILDKSTFFNNHSAPAEFRAANHGYVYADYYFLMIGNKLLELGLYK